MGEEGGVAYRRLTNSMLTASSNVASTNIRILANRRENFLMESGLYDLMMRSRKPEVRGSSAGSPGRSYIASGRRARMGSSGMPTLHFLGYELNSHLKEHLQEDHSTVSGKMC